MSLGMTEETIQQKLGGQLTMMRSLFSGVSGLKVHQTKMDVIGNNISNVNTVGFKSQSASFTDIFYQTTQSASGPNAKAGTGGQNAKQIGLGATVGAISTNISGRGGSQRTDNPFDLMINGDAFFIINKGGTNYFSKAGNFTVDGSGTLVTKSGAQVMGWPADKNGEVSKDRVSALRIMSSDKMTTPPEATTNSQLYGNINKESSAFSKTNDIDRYEPVTIKFYDAMGYSYDATYHIRQTGTQGEYTMNLFSISCEGKNLVQAEPNEAGDSYTYLNGGGEIKFTFNTGATTINSKEDGSGREITSGVINTVLQGSGTASAENLTVKLDFSNIAGKNKDGVPFVKPNSLANAAPIAIDLSQLTNYGSDTTVDSEYGDLAGHGKGKAVGNMSSIGIDSYGKIIASYTNGDTLILGQIAVAYFSNPSGLEKVGDNLFAATLNSGTFNGIGQDISANGDSFTTGVVEMSNVDLSTEFTEMITTQRGFQANSRIITTSDTLLEELINLKR